MKAEWSDEVEEKMPGNGVVVMALVGVLFFCVLGIVKAIDLIVDFIGWVRR